MIINNTPLSMPESLTYIKQKDGDLRNSDLIGFIKKFTELKPNQAKDMREKLNLLKNIKLKNEHISKIIELLPDNNEDLNKIFMDISLDEDESNKILDIVKQYK